MKLWLYCLSVFVEDVCKERNMFGRRVFCSGAIPRAMYSSLHISSRTQAQRLLPSMMPLVPSMGLVSMPAQSSLTVDGSGRSMVSASSDMADLEPLASSELIRSILVAMCSARLIELWGVHDGCIPMRGAWKGEM